MLSIGDFARLGQVSVRMLRHYDQVGLLTPARVDEFSGYRFYDPDQLARLHRILALKDLGFTLAEVRAIVDDELTAEELRGMLRLRRSQLAAEHAAAQTRLAGVEFRLHIIEQEKVMSTAELVTKSLPAVRLAAVTTTVGDRPEIAAAIEPMFDRTASAVAAAGGSLATPMAVYEYDEDDLRITAGFAYAGAPLEGVDIVELPEVEQAACAVHLGPMAGIGGSWQALHQAIGAHGKRPSGPCRELYVRAESPDQADWVTELQQPVVDA